MADEGRLFGREISLIVGALKNEADPMAQLFGAALPAGVYGTDVSRLRTQFRVTKTLDQKPNTIEISIWNLGPETRARTEAKNAKVLLSAGYKGATRLLFVGDMALVTHERQGPDWVTHMRAGDGLNAVKLGRVFDALSPGQVVHDVIGRMAKQMTVGLGNALRSVARGEPGEAVTEFVNGVAFEGSMHEEFDRVARALGYDWSVQDGQLHFTQPGKPDEREAFVLTPTSGLIGSPLMATKETQVGTRNALRCRSLLNADISPGRALRVEGEALKAWCRVESVQHSGDTHGDDWYTEIEASPL